MDIKSIKDPSFLKDLTPEQLNELSSDIREFLINNISKTGGHLSSNLGVVELTVALHYVFNSPKDKIFFDVGHQAYTHKILTGRANDFKTLRQYQGLSGFQKRCESVHDVWEAGHSSTALSGAVGMAIARDLDKENFHVIPVIGDAAMVGGASLEALNHLGSTDSKVIIIFNDNEMSISSNVGGINNFLSEVRTSMTYNKAKQEYKEMLSKSKLGRAFYSFTSRLKNFVKIRVIKPSIFSEFGVEYLGPIDGHDYKDLIRALNKAKISNKSIVVHVLTKKGKGYYHAENDKEGRWHGVAPFNVNSGELLSQPTNKKSYSEIISNHVLKLMDHNKDITVVTPAMISGSKLEKVFKKYPNRSFDVGIAEPHAMTFAAGLAISNKRPYITIYSSFIQRAYDQINHDVARMNLPVVIGIDRAGLVGEDGETHHGVFDLGILKDIPNLIIYTPSSVMNAKKFLNTAFTLNAPSVIRFAKESAVDVACDISEKLEVGKWQKVINQKNTNNTIICYGENVTKMKQFIKDQNLNVNLVDACFLKPMDEAYLDNLLSSDAKIIIYETILKSSGLASSILEYSSDKKYQPTLKRYGIGDHYTPAGRIDELIKHEGLDLESLKDEIVEYFK